MESDHADNPIGPETVAALLRAAGLAMDAGRLDDLSRMLETAREAAARLDEVAGRVPLADALAFDPAWQEEGRGA